MIISGGYKEIIYLKIISLSDHTSFFSNNLYKQFVNPPIIFFIRERAKRSLEDFERS